MFEASTIAAELQSELARLRTDGRDRPLDELVDLVGACQSVINQVAAIQTLAMAHVAAIEDVALEDGTIVEQHRGLGHQRLDAPALVSEQLGVSDAAASNRLGTAVDVVTRVTGAFEAMGEGLLDEYRARIVSDELREAPAEVCAEVVARIESTLGTEPPAALRRRVRRALESVDADLLRAKAARARSARSLCRWPGDEPGVDTWMGSFPTEQSRSGWAVIDGLARQYVRDGKAVGLDQARADALMDLIHARATGTFVVQLAVPAEIAVGAGGADDELVTVVGLGMPGTTEVRRSWLTALTDSAPHTAPDTRTGSAAGADATTNIGAAARNEVVACHASTGALLAVGANQLGGSGSPRATGSEAYRPPQGLIDLVKARDGRCRFPACTVNARFCDVDHVLPWPLGPTHAANLMCLCRRHHRVKQSIRWRVCIDPDATVTWTDPIGRRRSTLPLDFLQLDSHGQALRRDGEAAHCAATTETLETVGSAPVDSVGVLWSAWEEELAHELTRVERHVAGRVAGTRAADEPPKRRLLTAELSAGLDAFVVDPTLAASCPGPGRHHITKAGADPPF